MVQVIEQTDIGENIGQGLGQGTSSVLQMLLKAKVDKMQQRQKLLDLQSILGGRSAQGDISEAVPSIERSPSSPAELTDEQILAVNQIDPNLAKMMQTQRESGSRETAARFKETKDLRKDLLGQSKAARDNDMRLDRMKALNDSGELIGPLYDSMLKKLGFDMPALKNPASEDFEKLQNDMFRNIRDIFGARITNLEVESFLKTIPGLSNTSEGRNRIIRNLKLLNKGADLRVNAMKKITKEHGGAPPYDLGEQIEERIGPELDKIQVEFVEGGMRPIQGEKKLIKAQKGEKLNPELAKQFLQKANGDKEKARKLAKQYGYEF